MFFGVLYSSGEPVQMPSLAQMQMRQLSCASSICLWTLQLRVQK